jgi:hypothetical protein
MTRTRKPQNRRKPEPIKQNKTDLYCFTRLRAVPHTGESRENVRVCAPLCPAELDLRFSGYNIGRHT